MNGPMASQLASAVSDLVQRKGSSTPTVRRADWQTAVVTAVNSDGTVDIGDVRARRLETYLNAAVGDLIMVTQSGNGNWLAIGRTAPASDNEWTSYTPTVTNGGSVTWTTRTGWYKRRGKTVEVCVYLAVNAAGSGGSTVMVDMPSSVYRGTRQLMPMHTESVGPNGSHIGNGTCVFFTGGSGATSDRLRTSSNDGTNRDSNITGADLLAGGTITIQGWYREA